MRFSTPAFRSVASACLASLAILTPPAKLSADDLPNVVVIMADDFGWADIAAYRRYQSEIMGHDLSELGGVAPVATPQLDRLAAEGMMFTDAHAPASLCAPTRFSMLTGSAPYRNNDQWGTWGFTETQAFIKPSSRPRHVTVAEILKAAGYRTSFFGKMHLGGGSSNFNAAMPHFPSKYGFDYSFTVPAGIQDPPYIYFENDRAVKIDPLNPSRMSGDYLLGHETVNWAAGRYPGVNGDNVIDPGHAGVGDPNWNSSQNSIINSDKALAFIDDSLANYPEQPFLLYYCPPQMHIPHTPPIDFNPQADGSPHAPDDPAFQPVRGVTGGYDIMDMIVDLDRQVGKIVSKLEDPNGDGDTGDSILADTLIIFTSDNGGLGSKLEKELNQNGFDWAPPGSGLEDYDSTGVLARFKSFVVEGGHRAPFIARWGDGTPEGSRIAPGSVCTQLVASHDWVATMYELTGTSMAPEQCMDAVSLLPTLTGERPIDAPIRDFLLHQSQPAKFEQFGIRQGDYVLYFDGDRNPTSLFNLAEDLAQTNDLLDGAPPAEVLLLRDSMKAVFDQYDQFGDPRSTPLFVAPDGDPPAPDPAAFETAPQAQGPSVVSMAAVVGTDASGPVEYSFTETSGNWGGTDSGWQTDPSYSDLDLLPGTTYAYTVRMRDAAGITGQASAALSVDTERRDPTEGMTRVLIDETLNNGSFESGTGDVPDPWTAAPNGAPAPTSAKRANDRASQGGWSAVMGTQAESSGGAVSNLALDVSAATGYRIAEGDRFELSFDAFGGFGWDAGDEIDWSLFHTGDDSLGGAVTELCGGSIAPTAGNDTADYRTFRVSPGPVVEALAVGRRLFLSFTLGQGTEAGEFARIDAVRLEVISAGQADEDEDGIPDAFEIEHSLASDDAGDAAEDFDGDGVSNYEEYRAGTDLRDPSSRPDGVIEWLGGSGEGESLNISTPPLAAGRVYILEYSPNLNPPWRAVDAFVPEPSQLGQRHHFSATGSAGIGFYRVRIEWN